MSATVYEFEFLKVVFIFYFLIYLIWKSKTPTAQERETLERFTYLKTHFPPIHHKRQSFKDSEQIHTCILGLQDGAARGKPVFSTQLVAAWDLALGVWISVLLFLLLARLSRGAQRNQGSCLLSVRGNEISKNT